MSCSAANSRTAAALPARHSSGPPGRPVQTPSTISTGETSTCSTPMARAAGSTWKRVADEARTTVCPACRCAATSRQASGNSEPAMPCTNSRSPSSTSSSSVRLAQARMPSTVNFSKSSSVVTPCRPVSSSSPRSDGRHVQRAQVVPGEGGQGVAVDDRAVEVEERADPRALRAGLDVGDQLLLGPDAAPERGRGPGDGSTGRPGVRSRPLVHAHGSTPTVSRRAAASSSSITPTRPTTSRT